MEIGLSLGSNLGDRLKNLKQARESLSAIKHLALIDCSSVYETEPVDVLPEYAGMPFLNAVLIVDTDVHVELFLDGFLSIEKEMGRRRDNRNAPRPMDIDIIYAGNTVVKNTVLEIPHPRWSRRRFVVQPLVEIRPDLRIPGEKRTVREVLLTLPEEPKVVLFTSQW